MKDEKFPVYFSGSAKAFEFLTDARIEGTLLLPQPFVMSFKPQFLNVSQRCFLEPLLTIIVVNEEFKDTIIKNGFKISIENTVYIYFPFDVRVDDTLYKKGTSGFESLIKEVPRNQRDYFAKLIIWEQGKGDNSPQSHVNRISTMISKQLKASIEKRIASLSEQSARTETQPLTFGKIARLHVLKMKLIKIYEHLKMHSQVTPILTEEYQYICLNKFYFKNEPVSKSRKLTYNPTLVNVEMVVELLRTEDINLLEFMTHCFYQIFTHLAKTLKIVEALIFLRQFLTFVKGNVLETSHETIEKVLQNVWTIQLVESALAIVQVHKNLLTQTRRAEIDVLQASLKLYVKDVLQDAGSTLYGFNQSLFHSLNVDLELQMLSVTIRQNRPRQERQAYNKSLDEGKQKEKIDDIVNSELKKTLSSYAQFIECYMRYLEEMVTLLKETRLRRVLQHLSIILLKAKVEFPWLKIQTNFEEIQSEANLESWKGLLLLRSIYLYLYYRSIGNKELQDREIGLVLSNEMLSETHRYSLLELLSEMGEHLELPCCRLGEITKILPIELEESCYQFTLDIDLAFSCTDLFDRLEVQLSDPKDPENSQKIAFTKEQLTYLSGNRLRTSTIFKTKSRLTQQVECVHAYHKKIHFVLPLSKNIKDTVLQFNGASIEGSWKFGANVVYCHVLTPYTLNVKCMKSCKNICLRYMAMSDIVSSTVIQQISQILKGGKSLQCEAGRVGINLSEFKFEGILELQLLFRATKQEAAAREFIIDFQFTLEDGKSETITHPVKYSTANALAVSYQAGDRLFQYGLTNIQPHPINIQVKGQLYRLEETEEVTTRSQAIQAGLDERFMVSVLLKDICVGWHPVASDTQMFKLKLLGMPLRVLQTANIESDQVGTITVIAHDGYELVGKIKGLQSYQTGHCLQLSIVPVRKGRIVLPEIYIDGKKGQWTTPVVLDVE